MSKKLVVLGVPTGDGYVPLQKGFVPSPGPGNAPKPGGKPQGGHVPTGSGGPSGPPPNTGSGVKPPPKK